MVFRIVGWVVAACSASLRASLWFGSWSVIAVGSESASARWEFAVKSSQVDGGYTPIDVKLSITMIQRLPEDAQTLHSEMLALLLAREGERDWSHLSG